MIRRLRLRKSKMIVSYKQKIQKWKMYKWLKKRPLNQIKTKFKKPSNLKKLLAKLISRF